VYNFAEELYALQLTDRELAGYAAVVLIDPDRIGVKDASIIQKLGERMEAALTTELSKRPSEHREHIRTILFERISVLHALSHKHNMLLNHFKHTHPTIEFPPLHKELFSQDHYNNNNNENSEPHRQ